MTTPALRDALSPRGRSPGRSDDAEIARVESGRPRYGVDLDETVIPQEAGLNERAVSFTKGCYVGQETVARLFYKGKPNRHLRGLRLSARGRPGDAAAARRARGRPLSQRRQLAAARPDRARAGAPRGGAGRRPRRRRGRRHGRGRRAAVRLTWRRRRLRNGSKCLAGSANCTTDARSSDRLRDSLAACCPRSPRCSARARGDRRVSGCGSDSLPDPVASAVAATRARPTARRSRCEIGFQGAGAPPKGIKMNADGVADMKAGEMQMTMDARRPRRRARKLAAQGRSGRPQDRDAARRQDPLHAIGLLSSQLPKGKSWIKVDVRKLGQNLGVDVSQLSQYNDPTKMLDYLRSSGEGRGGRKRDDPRRRHQALPRERRHRQGGQEASGAPAAHPARASTSS